MEYQYGRVLPLEEAVAGYLAFLAERGVALAGETIPVARAYKRVTAGAAFAVIPSPHYNASAMDGIAIRSRDTFGATSTTPVFLTKEQFVTVDTGDPLPNGFDAVAMIEDVVYQPDGRVRLDNAYAPWNDVRQVGEDICEGDMIIPSYTRVSAAHLGALLAGGVREIEVLKPLRAAILPTGDEIVPADALPKAGEITDFNSAMFAAMLSDFGCEITVCGIIKDNLQNLTAKVKELSENFDLVLVNAGSSAGRDDYTASAFRACGEVFCHGLSIRPGKPAIMGAGGRAALIGLPGYPVSAMVVMENLVFPVVEFLQKSYAARPPQAGAVLGRRVVSDLKYEEFVRVKLGQIEGRLIASPMARGAGVISSLAQADGMMVIPRESEGLEAGEQVKVSLMKPAAQLENTMVVNGSHDPIIDLLGDMLRRKDHRFFVSSSHTGSMGGITAIKKGEAMLAPIHLLDPASGVYNRPSVERYLKDCGVTLIKGARRVQGLITLPGNPKGIKNINGLLKDGVRFINRQKGSGTRVLLDYLLEKEGIDPQSIIGYDNEMYTHTAVATQVFCGNADAGLGVYSAAKLYGLDFTPLYDEEYDFVMRDDCRELPVVRLFLEILASGEFKTAVERLGGYRFA